MSSRVRIHYWDLETVTFSAPAEIAESVKALDGVSRVEHFQEEVYTAYVDRFHDPEALAHKIALLDHVTRLADAASAKGQAAP